MIALWPLRVNSSGSSIPVARSAPARPWTLPATTTVASAGASVVAVAAGVPGRAVTHTTMAMAALLRPLRTSMAYPMGRTESFRPRRRSTGGAMAQARLAPPRPRPRLRCRPQWRRARTQQRKRHGAKAGLAHARRRVRWARCSLGTTNGSRRILCGRWWGLFRRSQRPPLRGRAPCSTRRRCAACGAVESTAFSSPSKVSSREGTTTTAITPSATQLTNRRKGPSPQTNTTRASPFSTSPSTPTPPPATSLHNAASNVGQLSALERSASPYTEAERWRRSAAAMRAASPDGRNSPLQANGAADGRNSPAQLGGGDSDFSAAVYNPMETSGQESALLVLQMLAALSRCVCVPPPRFLTLFPPTPPTLQLPLAFNGHHCDYF